MSDGGGFIKKINRIVEKMAEIYEMRPVLYYKVPECPECGSNITGRYVKRPRSKWDASYVIRESLKNGELVRLVDSVPIENAYCEECGHEWPVHLGVGIYPAWKVEEQKKLRKTYLKYWEARDSFPKKPFWNRFTGFFS